MIARNQTLSHRPTWQAALADAITDPAELVSLLGHDAGVAAVAREAAAEFGLRVPRPFLARMRRGDAEDPLLRQVLPTLEELVPVAGFTCDPLGEHKAMPVPGLLQKYRGRALLLLTSACAVHCRYCFRRHFPYSQANHVIHEGSPALAYLARDPSIEEVILSGGDPLCLSDGRLRELVRALSTIAHLRRVRIHTRMPVVLPERVQSGLLGALCDTRLKPVVVVHVNHAQELDEAAMGAARRLAASGITLLNQSVLLAGVNDSVEALADLSQALFETGILPYYLHLLDPVQGAAHFAVPLVQARSIYAGLRARLPGYLVPRLVYERSGAGSKLPLA